MSQISYLLLKAIQAHLEKGMNLGLAKRDPRWVDLVKLGRFQEDPTDPKKSVHLAITLGDPKLPDLTDGVFGLAGGESRQEDIGLDFPAYEIGGGTTWVRRGRVDIGCYYLTSLLKEEVAMEAATSILGRVERLLPTAPIAGITDEFGELAILLNCFGNTFFESGGANQWVWRGTVKWQVTTERPS